MNDKLDPVSSADHATLRKVDSARDPAVALSLLPPFLAGLYLLLTSTMIVIPGIWPYDAKRILQFVLLLIVFVLPVINPRIRTEFSAHLKAVPAWMRYSFMVIIAIGLLSVAVNARSAMHAVNSLSEVVLMGVLVPAVVLFASCRQISGRYFDYIVLGAFAITALAVGAQELSGVLAAHSGGAEFTFRISLLYFSWPRFFNQVQGWMLLPLTGLVILFPRNRLALVVAVLAIGLQWYVMLMTGARGLFLSTLAGLAFALLFLPAIRKKLLSWQAAGLLAGALIYALVLFSFEPPGADSAGPLTGRQHPGQATPSSGGHYGNEDSSTSSFYSQSLGRPMLNTSGRLSDWRLSIGIASENPWLGIGPNNYVCTAEAGMSHPHNFPMQLAVEWGLPVALLSCMILLVLLKNSIAYARDKPGSGDTERLLFNVFLAGVFTSFTYSLLSGVFIMPASQVTGVLACGLLAGLARPNGDQPRRDVRPRTFIVYPILAIGLLALGLFELSTMEERSALLTPEYTMYPRIWQDAMVCRFYAQP